MMKLKLTIDTRRFRMVITFVVIVYIFYSAISSFSHLRQRLRSDRKRILEEVRDSMEVLTRKRAEDDSVVLYLKLQLSHARFLNFANDEQKAKSAEAIKNLQHQLFSNQSLKDEELCLALATAKIIMCDLRRKTHERLSYFIHPEDGVRFSKYGTVDLDSDNRFTATQFRKALKTNTNIYWGISDGSADTIQLNINDYFDTFVYPIDYLAFPPAALQTSALAHDNAKTIYPDCFFSEWYVPEHFDKAKNQYRPWTGLRLVLKKWQHQFYLVGIIHYSFVI